VADSFETENTGGLLSGFLAEEDQFDRRALWRLGSWGAASVGAVIVALLASQSSIGMRREHLAAADLVRQSQQIQSVARENQEEARRLASAVDTLNGDRDRLYSRVTVLEQGLDTVTGATARQNPAAASLQPAVPAAATTEPQAALQVSTAAPAVSPVTTTVAKTSEKPKLDAAIAAEKPKTDAAVAVEKPEKPKTDAMAATEKPKTDAVVAEQGPASVTPAGQGAPNTQVMMPASSLMASKSMMAAPDAAAAKLIEPDRPSSNTPTAPAPETVAAVSSAMRDAPEATAPKVAIQRTEFAVDIGGANSIGGLRALWRGLLKSNTALADLRPIIVVKEGRTGLGMQLRLAAGPLGDAAAAAKICAGLIENQRSCETTIFDGQRLAVNREEPTTAKPVAAKPGSRRRGTYRRVTSENAPIKQETSTLASFFSRL
jgi:hypothetical protein